MRVWKEVTLVFILFGASFFLLLMKTTSPVRSSYPKAFGISFEPSLKPLATALEPPPSSSSSSARKPVPRRAVRATEDMGSFLSECKRNLFPVFLEQQCQHGLGCVDAGMTERFNMSFYSHRRVYTTSICS